MGRAQNRELGPRHLPERGCGTPELLLPAKCRCPIDCQRTSRSLEKRLRLCLGSIFGWALREGDAPTVTGFAVLRLQFHQPGDWSRFSILQAVCGGLSDWAHQKSR